MADYKKMKSAIPAGNNVRPFVQASPGSNLRGARATGEVVKAARSQEVKAAASDLVLAGTGDVDNRKMLTPALSDMQTVTRISGNAVSGDIAYSTTKDDGKEYRPDFFDGLFAPMGFFPAPAETTPNPNADVRALRPVAANRSRPGDINGMVIQKPTVW